MERRFRGGDDLSVLLMLRVSLSLSERYFHIAVISHLDLNLEINLPSNHMSMKVDSNYKSVQSNCLHDCRDGVKYGY